MKLKSFLRTFFLLALLVALAISMTGCFGLPDIDELSPSEDVLELVGVPTMTYVLDEELGFYEVYVEGVAKNVSELDINNCSVSFGVYDVSGNLICVAEDYVAALGEGVNWRFAAVGMTRYEPYSIEIISLSGYDW